MSAPRCQPPGPSHPASLLWGGIERAGGLGGLAAPLCEEGGQRAAGALRPWGSSLPSAPSVLSMLKSPPPATTTSPPPPPPHLLAPPPPTPPTPSPPPHHILLQASRGGCPWGSCGRSGRGWRRGGRACGRTTRWWARRGRRQVREGGRGSEVRCCVCEGCGGSGATGTCEDRKYEVECVARARACVCVEDRAGLLEPAVPPA